MDSRGLSKLIAYDERKLQEAIRGAEACEAALVALAAPGARIKKMDPTTPWQAPVRDEKGLGRKNSSGITKRDDVETKSSDVALRLQYIVQIVAFRQAIGVISQRLLELQPDRVL